MTWMTMKQSLLLKPGDSLTINQRVSNILTSLNVNIDVKNRDEVSFIRSECVNEASNEHTFWVILQEDLRRMNTIRVPEYGEFTVKNFQVSLNDSK